jgi:hypothetical protein
MVGAVADHETIIGITTIDIVKRVGWREPQIDRAPTRAAVKGLD